MSIEHFPPPLRNWIEEEAHATQTPIEMATMLALSVCSAAIAKRVEVEARPGYDEPANLFGLVLADPASRKSKVFSDATKPLRDIEAELIAKAAAEVARSQSEYRQAEARVKALEKKSAKVDNNDYLLDQKTAASAAAELADREPLHMPCLIVDDVTSEMMAIMLGQQKGRLMVASPEGGPFDNMAGKYTSNGGASFDVYLKGHAGDDLKIDRVSRPSVRVDHPALTCCFAIQPAVIRGVSDNPSFRGRGLLGRFLYVWPKGRIGNREIAARPMSEEAQQGYHALVRRLYREASRFGVDGTGIEDEPDSFGEFDAFDSEPARSSGDPFVLRLDDDASLRFIAWEHEAEDMLAAGGRMETFRDWGGKLCGATLRLAAVLHCAELGVCGEIGLGTMETAVALARVLISHAERVLCLMGAGHGSEDSDAAHLLRWIDRQGRKSFSKRDVFQGHKSRFQTADDANDPLRELVERGYIRSVPAGPPQRGRPASPLFNVNPHQWEI